eukprot:scaffold4655_cov115-Isochrysis_galbana.AAC.4
MGEQSDLDRHRGSVDRRRRLRSAAETHTHTHPLSAPAKPPAKGPAKQAQAARAWACTSGATSRQKASRLCLRYCSRVDAARIGASATTNCRKRQRRTSQRRHMATA